MSRVVRSIGGGVGGGGSVVADTRVVTKQNDIGVDFARLVNLQVRASHMSETHTFDMRSTQNTLIDGKTQFGSDRADRITM